MCRIGPEVLDRVLILPALSRARGGVSTGAHRGQSTTCERRTVPRFLDRVLIDHHPGDRPHTEGEVPGFPGPEAPP